MSLWRLSTLLALFAVTACAQASAYDNAELERAWQTEVARIGKAPPSPENAARAAAALNRARCGPCKPEEVETDLLEALRLGRPPGEIWPLMASNRWVAVNSAGGSSKDRAAAARALWGAYRTAESDGQRAHHLAGLGLLMLDGGETAKAMETWREAHRILPEPKQSGNMLAGALARRGFWPLKHSYDWEEFEGRRARQQRWSLLICAEYLKPLPKASAAELLSAVEIEGLSEAEPLRIERGFCFQGKPTARKIALTIAAGLPTANGPSPFPYRFEIELEYIPPGVLEEVPKPAPANT